MFLNALAKHQRIEDFSSLNRILKIKTKTLISGMMLQKHGPLSSCIALIMSENTIK